MHERILASAKKMGLTVYSYDGSAASGLPFPIITECVLRPNDSRIFFPAECVGGVGSECSRGHSVAQRLLR